MFFKLDQKIFFNFLKHFKKVKSLFTQFKTNIKMTNKKRVGSFYTKPES